MAAGTVLRYGIGRFRRRCYQSGNAYRRRYTQIFPEALPGMSYWHLALNRNKRGITADIKTEGGRKLLLRLLSEADVF